MVGTGGWGGEGVRWEGGEGGVVEEGAMHARLRSFAPNVGMLKPSEVSGVSSAKHRGCDHAQVF